LPFSPSRRASRRTHPGSGVRSVTRSRPSPSSSTASHGNTRPPSAERGQFDDHVEIFRGGRNSPGPRPSAPHRRAPRPRRPGRPGSAPVQAEQPDRVRPAAPALQVVRPSTISRRIGSTSRSVASSARDVIGQVHPAAPGQGVPELVQDRLLDDLVHLDGHLGARRGGFTGRRFQLGDGAVQRLASSTPGIEATWPISASIRSATSSALASSTARRSGRSIDSAG